MDYLPTMFCSTLIFTFQSGYIPILVKRYFFIKKFALYIPIWLYSNLIEKLDKDN